jgi:catechol 2,3-dioxygenase-like lactoylglutathione lyase family enzyme
VIEVRRIDFVARPVEDLAGADAWYGGTLGLARNPKASGERWVEYETGNLTLALSTFGGTLAFGVDDVEAARSLLEGAGVEFAGETFDSGVCHGASFTDPFGNRLQLHHRYAPLEPYEPPAQEVERTDFVNVPVTDRARGLAFYTETLGLERNPLASEEWPEFHVGATTLLLTTPEQTGTAFRAGDYAVALRVADVAGELERLRGNGVAFQFPEVYDSSVCHMAFFRDPDGNAFILHHRYAPYADGSTP